MARIQILKDSTTEVVRAIFSRRPSSCNVEIYDSGGNVLTASAAATLGLTTTLTAAAGYGETDKRVVPVTAITNMVFLGNYLIINAALQREAVRLIKIPADKDVEVDKALRYAYASGDTFESCEVTRTITAAETASTRTNCRARFTATLPDSSVVVKDVIFDVVKHQLHQPVTANNLSTYLTNASKLLPVNQRGTDWAVFLDNAWSELLEDFVTKEILPEGYMSPTRLAQLQIYKLKIMMAEEGIKVGEEEFPMQTAKYFTAKYNTLLDERTGRAPWYDVNRDLVPGTSQAEKEPSPPRRVL